MCKVQNYLKEIDSSYSNQTTKQQNNKTTKWERQFARILVRPPRAWCVTGVRRTVARLTSRRLVKTSPAATPTKSKNSRTTTVRTDVHAYRSLYPRRITTRRIFSRPAVKNAGLQTYGTPKSSR